MFWVLLPLQTSLGLLIQLSKKFNLKLSFFPYLSVYSCVLGALKNRLIETTILSTLNICFGWEIRKIIFSYTLLSFVVLIELTATTLYILFYPISGLMLYIFQQIQQRSIKRSNFVKPGFNTTTFLSTVNQLKFILAIVQTQSCQSYLDE